MIGYVTSTQPEQAAYRSSAPVFHRQPITLAAGYRKRYERSTPMVKGWLVSTRLYSGLGKVSWIILSSVACLLVTLFANKNALQPSPDVIPARKLVNV